MSMVVTFLCTTNHAKAFTFDKFDFQIKLVTRKGIVLEGFDNAMKKDFIENEPVEDDVSL